MVPGQRLVEPELADRFDVTRTGVRAALIDLAAEGLVERAPHRSSRVRVVPPTELVAITECRMVLEGLCAAKAAADPVEGQLAALEDLGAALTKAAEAGDLPTYSELDIELHACVREFSGQRAAVELLDRLSTRPMPERLRSLSRPGRLRQSLREHLAVIEAITARDPRAAEEAARAHLRQVVATLRPRQLHQADPTNEGAGR